jgi:filamentous hemagglutinin family protein
MGRTGFDVLRHMLLATSCLVAAPLMAASGAFAASPTGSTVVAGHATVTSPSSTSTVVTQSSNKALIDWSSFSLSAGSSVTFDQPNSKSITVNRVTGNGASDIYGDLFANGRIWLINGNGILFGKGSEINVGALIATTSDMTNEDFRKGRYAFAKPSDNAAASVVNQGSIHAADRGYVVLSGSSVSNAGVIQANLGTVVLGGASAFTVDMKGDNLIRYQVTAPVSKTPTDANGSAAAALVSNSGTIQANGGKVLMTARAAHNVEDNVINNTGLVEATSVSAHDGEIDLDAGPDGTVSAGGTLDASGKGAGQTGGTVQITGGTVNVADGARIDASGDAGGGIVRIGGDFHGKGKLRDASQTNIGNATIDVDAISKGNGGQVAIWSNNATNFSGTVSAKGGAHGGNGGYVETSGGALQVGLNAIVNTSATAGKSGTWLIDPTNIVIATGGNTSLSGGVLGVGGEGTDTIAPSTIVNALEGGTDVLLEASNDITVSNDVIYSSANNLSLLAENNIEVDANIQNTLASGGGGINLIAGWNGTTLPPSSLTAPGVYAQEAGDGEGSIMIGGENASGNVAVGSASGLLTVAGANITVEADDGYAQLGYHGTGGGGIALVTTGDLTLQSGEGTSLYAQIGNGDASGGNTGIGNVGGDIDVQVGGSSEFNSSGSASWLGNVAGPGAIETGNVTLVTNSGFVPGDFITADLGTTAGTGGNVTIGFTTTGEVFLGGLNYSSANDFAFLAAGDMDVTGSVTNLSSGAITLVAGWDGVTLGSAAQLRTSGAYGQNDAVMTIGGEDADGDVDVGSALGTTTVLSGDLDIDAESGIAQLGYHGNGIGDIAAYLTGDLTLTGSSEDSADYAQIGNGDATGTNESVGSVGGNISIVLPGTITFDGYSGDGGGVAWLGNVAGTQGTAPIESGNLTLISGDEDDNGDNDLGQMIQANLGSTSSPGSGGNVTIGFTDPEDGITEINHAGTVNSPNTLTVLSTGDILVESSLLNQGSGDVTLISGWNTDVISTGDVINTTNAGGSLVGLFTGATGSYGADDSDVGIGGPDAEGATSVGSKSGATTVLTSNLVVDAADGDAQLGYAGSGSGDIDVLASDTVSVIASSSHDAHIGNGGFEATGPFGGDVNITAGAVDLDVASSDASVQIGNGGSDATGTASGNVSVTATTGDVSLGVIDTSADIQIGNGGSGFNGNTSGNVTVAATNGNVEADVAIDGSYIQIGNGGYQSTGNDAGSITLSALDNVSLETSDDADTEHELTAGSYIQVGNGGPQSNENSTTGFSETGDIAVSGADITLLTTNASTADSASGVKIGNGGDCAGCVTDEDLSTTGPVTFGGNITITAAQSLDMEAQGTFNGAQIGNGGTDSGNGLNLTSGALTDSGTIDVTVGTAETTGTLTMTTGTPGNSVVSIGNGGLDADDGATAAGGVSILGDINVTVNGGDAHGASATLDAAGTASNLVQIGNIGTGVTDGTVSGDVTFNVDGTLEFDSTPGIGLALAGDTTGVSGADTGTTSIEAQKIDGIDASLDNDIMGGDVTAAVTGTDAVVIDHAVDYSSTHTLDVLAAGDIDVESSVDNDLASGGGAINFVAGWDGHTTTPSSFTTAGVYGNNGGSVNIGGESAAGNASLGDASGMLTVAADNILLEADNGYAQLGYHGAGGGNIDAVASGNLTMTGGETGGDFAQLGNGSLDGSIEGNVTGDITTMVGGSTTFSDNDGGGRGWLGNFAGSDYAETGNLTLITNSGFIFGDNIVADLGSGDGSGGNVFIGFNGGEDIFIGGVSYTSANAFTFLTTGNMEVDGSVQNAGSGAITLVAGWDGHTVGSASALQTANAYGLNDATMTVGGTYAGGDVAVGSASGTTTILSDDLVLEADNGLAQIGFQGGATGDIDVAALGDVTLTGGGETGQYAQIGNGGYQSSGNFSGAINVTAGGDVTLTGGGGQEAYAQIGDGGAESNANSEGYTNDAVITVSGQTVTLDAGAGQASYAQIGNGGYEAGEGLTGAGNNGGDITVDAVNSISLNGNGADGYAQIGNGGDQTNAGATSGASGANSGDIVVAVTDADDGSLDMTAGTGANSYVQIGNGGYASNSPTTAPASSFSDSGTIMVSDLSLTGSDTGADGYAQIGNGDASKTGVGDVSGDITVLSPDAFVITNGTAPGASAMIGGATGDGTVTGTINGVSPTPPNNTQQTTSTVASLITPTPTPGSGGSNIVIATPLTPPQDSGATSTGLTDNTTAAPNPLQQMADSSDNGDSDYEASEPSDTATVTLGKSLNSGPSGHSKPGTTVTLTLIPGMLKQVVSLGPNAPHGVPPADQDYSSWGNEALWQW